MVSAAIDRLCDVTSGRLGLIVPASRHQQLERVVRGYAAQRGTNNPDEIAAWIESMPFEAEPWQKIIAEITVPETRFLRQRTWLQQVEQLALKPLIERRRSENVRRIRCWSAGCATGEEPYTLALIIREMLPDYQDWSVEILATDISLAALATASHAVYARRQLRELDEAHIEKYFTAVGDDHFRLNAGLRGDIKFQASNLSEAAFGGSMRPQAEFDLVVCRNVLIYFGAEAQRRVAVHLAASVAPQGCLAVAPAEASADWFAALTPVNAPEAILFFRYHRAPEARELKSRPHATSIGPAIAAPTASIRSVARPPRETAPKRDAAAEIAELRALADRGLLAEARHRCQTLLVEDQLNSGASLLLTEICVELGDLDSACIAARHTVFLSPESAIAYYLLGTILVKQGETLKARRAMSTALSLAGEVPLDTPTSVDSESMHGHIRRGAAAFLDTEATRRRRPKHDRA